ncbi:MMPL family transporter [Nesterenkonia populi]
MASLLQRLGLFAARRAKTVIAAWFALLAIAVTSFLSFGGELTDQITMPDLESTDVTKRLAEEIPEASGGSGSAVLQTTDGEPFDQGQISDIADLAAQLERESAVDSVTDPFVSEEEMAEAQDELEDGRAELEEGQEELDRAREEIEGGTDEIEAGYEELSSAQAELDAAIEEARTEGWYDAAAAQFEQQQAEIDAGVDALDESAAELDAGAEELSASEDELASGQAELERGEEFLELASGAQMVADEDNVAIMMINFHEPMESVGVEELGDVSETLTGSEISGVEVLPSGDLDTEMPHLFSVAEAIGLMIAAAVLLIMLGTLIGAGLPLLNALVGVGIGVAGAMAFSGIFDMMSMTPVLGLMLGLAVGIDYSLFILHRHRRQLKDGMGLRTSIGLANGTAGNAVVFAGATVIIALLALNVTGLPFLALMGSVAAACVAVAVLLAVTMTPAMMSLAGPRLLTRKERRRGEAPRAQEITQPLSTPKALGIAASALAALAILAVPTLSLRLGLPDASSNAEDSDAYQAYVATEEAFGEGLNGPLLVTADLPGGLGEEEATDHQIDIARSLEDHSEISATIPAALNDDYSLAVFQVIPEEGPAAESVEELVYDLRGDDALTGAGLEGVDISVAGLPAANIDISDVISDVMPLYLALVIGLSLVLMIIVFRSILLPVIATLGFVGSIASAMGVVVAVFQWGWFGDIFGITEPGPIVTFLPVITIGILFGLAMDYQLFTASGMREAYAHGAPPRLAVRQGLHAGRSVVTAAALIMGSVFGGFVFTPDPITASIGLALAVGVLLDAFVVRLLLVPALLHLAGPAAWWLPTWLDRILPDADVEGTALERHVDTQSTAAEAQS